MKLTKSALFLFVLLLCITACAREGSGAGSSMAGEESSAASSVAEEPAKTPTLAFAEPENPYWILGECAYEGGYLALYEEAFPDEYNKQFSNDMVFHALRWQLFDADGARTGEGDANWSNGFPLHDLPLSEFEAADGLITFSVGMPEEYSGWPFRRRFTLVADDARLSMLGENPNGYRYQVEDWYPLYEQEGYRLENCTSYDWTTDRSVNRLLLTDPAGERREAVFDCDDRDFWWELMQLNMPGYVEYEGEEPAVSQMRIALDPEGKTAVFTIPKLTATVDFNTGETAMERHYTEETLETKIVESADGRYAVYTVGEFDRFESIGGCDYVSVGPDGEIHFLYAGSALDQLALIGNDRVLANTFDRLICYDAATGLPSDRQVEFDFGQTELRGEIRSPKQLVIGLAVDQQNERILAAHRLNTFGDWELEVDGKTLDTFPVTLSVFDFSGSLLTEVETGLSIQAFTLYTLIPVELSTDQAGTATLSAKYPDQGGKVTVPYPIG